MGYPGSRLEDYSIMELAKEIKKQIPEASKDKKVNKNILSKVEKATDDILKWKNYLCIKE